MLVHLTGLTKLPGTLDKRAEMVNNYRGIYAQL